MLQSDDIKRQDLLHWYAWLLRNRYSREAAWKWLVDEWQWISDTMSTDKNFSLFARYAGSVFSTKAEQKQFLNCFEPKLDIIALTRDIKLAKQEISSKLAWRARNEAAVKAWLTKQ